ncbi:MAG: polysulfide reductase NrfD [Chloroflexi bacterium]|nr:polysulfide reductase NrfD [Chloroflexota bacterium]
MSAMPEERFLSPILHTTKKFYLFAGLLALGVVWFIIAWIIQLRTGLVVTGMRDVGAGGAAWGIYITNFVFFIGITHAGIAIASAIRLFKLKDYIPLARIAELVTIFSLMMAALSIVMDMGRPDRVFNIILNYPSRIQSSPLVWDITAVAVYLIFGVTYLYMEMREDLAKIAGKVKWGWLYRRLIPGYVQGERERIERVVFWASIFNFPIMVMVHTTVGWIFGLQVARPGWYSSILGPYYVIGAVLSGVAAVVVMTAIYRRIFHWLDIIKPVVFRGLGRFLSWVSIFYIYFITAEFITVKWAGPLGELRVSMAWSHQEFALFYWLQILAFIIAFTIFFINTVFPKLFRIWTTVFASALVVVTLWVTRFLIVVPSLTRPLLPYEIGSYTPTWVEWSLVGGTFAIIALLFMIFTKVLPIIPLTEMERAEKEE